MPLTSLTLYNYLGFVFTILEQRRDTSLPEEDFYKTLILKFCKLCNILHAARFYDEEHDNNKHYTPGIPKMACIIWGDMGPPHHSELRIPLQGGRGYIVTTSIPYMVGFDAVNMRGQLLNLRANDLQNALHGFPGVVLPERTQKPTWGHCAEHPGVTVYVCFVDFVMQYILIHPFLASRPVAAHIEGVRCDSKMSQRWIASTTLRSKESSKTPAPCV